MTGNGPMRGLRVLVVAVTLFAFTGCSGTSGEPDPGGATVEVDIFSGKLNPTVPLCDGATDELRSQLDARSDDAQEAVEPDLPLGFRGFIVTLDDPDGPDGVRTVRIVGDAAYIDRDGQTMLLADDGVLFDIVWGCVKTEIDPAIADEIEKAIG